jgi:hypothetical protein
VIIDPTAAARRPDEERVREWLTEQRVFISSAMGDTAEERRAVAQAVEEEGARPVWFEEFGARDADPEEAYLGEVDSSTIYLAILNELYGRQHRSGFSATDTEYLRAREGGKRVAVWTAANAPAREGHLNRFIERLRVFHTTEDYSDAADLARRVRRRLRELAAEALSPWVKLGDYVFRADEIEDGRDRIAIRARASDEIARQLEAMREGYTRIRLRFAYGHRVVEGDLVGVRRTVRATGSSETTTELEHVARPQHEPMRAGGGGLTPDELVEAGLRHFFLAEALPGSLGGLEFMAETGLDEQAVHECFALQSEIAEPIARVVISDGLVGSGHATTATHFSLGPRDGDRRRIELEWEDVRTYQTCRPLAAASRASGASAAKRVPMRRRKRSVRDEIVRILSGRGPRGVRNAQPPLRARQRVNLDATAVGWR